MAKKKNDGASGLILVVLIGVVWGAWMLFKALMNFNEKLTGELSNLPGITILTFTLILLICFIVGWIITRKCRVKEQELTAKRAALDEDCKRFEERLALRVEENTRIEKEKLRLGWQKYQNAKEKSARTLQRIVDSAYKFKSKTLLTGVTVNNFQMKYDQLKKEREDYEKIITDIHYLDLRDNSDWKGTHLQFIERVAFLQKAQEEKEEQAELKRQMREEKQREEELERQQKEAEQKEKQLEQQQLLIDIALAKAEGDHRAELERQRVELEMQIAEVHQQYERAKSMAQLTKQGHVYIISNIGSFGEDVYKVGMTRRLEPMDRVKELGDASVPFDFDVHAMISCNDAPALEKALHDRLHDYRMNRINLRKEFFRVELGEIIKLVEEHHGQVDYIADAAALQYLQSQECIEDTAA